MLARMKKVAFLLLISTLSGCSPGDGTPPEAYVTWADRLVARFPVLAEFHELCRDGEVKRAYEHCYRFEKQRRWSGIIVQNDYYESAFYPGRAGFASEPPHSSRYAVAGLPPRHECQSALCRPLDGDAPDEDRPPPKAFAVEFIGRRTAVEGRYGHMGIFGHQIIVDRLLAERAIQRPTR
jgi:hypothetical protein